MIDFVKARRPGLKPRANLAVCPFMKTNKLACVVLSSIALLAARAAESRTADFWQCSNKIGGQWAFGNAPNACSVNHKESPTKVRTEFSPVLFQDARTSEAERGRYISELYPAMRDFAAYYIKRRNPSVSAAEIKGFQTALFSLAHQESFWSHYRDGADGLVRYMRGDSGHGHGIMQIDDNAHFARYQRRERRRPRRERRDGTRRIL